jgi:transcription elongation factor Elf1
MGLASIWIKSECPFCKEARVWSARIVDPSDVFPSTVMLEQFGTQLARLKCSSCGGRFAVEVEVKIEQTITPIGRYDDLARRV